MGRVEDDHRRPIRDERLELVGIDDEVALLPQGKGDGRRPAVGHKGLVGGKPGAGDDDLVALVDAGEDGGEEDGLDAGGDGDAGGLDVDTPLPLEKARDGLAKGLRPRRGRVVCRSAAEGRHGCLRDVFFCVEIGLSDGETDDIPALGLKGLDAGQDLEGPFNSETTGSFGYLHDSFPPLPAVEP